MKTHKQTVLMIEKIKKAMPAGKYEYIDNIKIDLLIPIQRHNTGKMLLFDYCLANLIAAGIIESCGNRIRINQ